MSIITIFLIKLESVSETNNSDEKLLTPLKEFVFRNSFFKDRNNSTIYIFFKFGDVVAGIMANPFYVKIGFTNIEIANASKIFGVIMTLFGVFIGGYLVNQVGLINSLIVSGIFQIFSNLLYVMLNNVGAEFVFLLITVAGENFSGGLGSAAFVAYLSVLCKKKYSATQYALLSSFMGLARTFLSSPSGFIVESFGWGNFYYFNHIWFTWFINSFMDEKKISIEIQISGKN